MSIDINNYIEAALEDMKDEMENANRVMRKIWESPWSNEIDGDLEKLEELLRSACDSVEIFNNYNGYYDRVNRMCWGPGCYEVQCRLCEVQRSCADETEKRKAEEGVPDCFGEYPTRPEYKCRACPVSRLCRMEAYDAAEKS
jgi:hypothetical protein